MHEFASDGPYAVPLFAVGQLGLDRGTVQLAFWPALSMGDAFGVLACTACVRWTDHFWVSNHRCHPQIAPSSNHGITLRHVCLYVKALFLTFHLFDVFHFESAKSFHSIDPVIYFFELYNACSVRAQLARICCFVLCWSFCAIVSN